MQQPPLRGPGTFRDVGLTLAGELVQSLEQEHAREVSALYQEQVRLRDELRRVVDVMQREIIPRERQLHDLLENLNQAYAQATTDLHQSNCQFLSRSQQSSSQHDRQRQQMLDPLADMETELARMRRMIEQPPVAVPDLPPAVLQEVRQQVQQRMHRRSQPPRSLTPTAMHAGSRSSIYNQMGIQPC